MLCFTVLTLLQRILLERNKGLVYEKHVFLRNTCFSRRAHPHVVYWPVLSTLHYKQNSFLSLTILMWKSFGTEVVIFWLLRDERGIKYIKIIAGICNNNNYRVNTKLKVAFSVLK